MASRIVSLKIFCFRVQIMGSKFKGPSDTPAWKFHAGVLEVEPSGASQNAGTGGGVPQHLPKRWYRGFHLWYRRLSPSAPAKTLVPRVPPLVPEVESLSTCQNAGTGGSTSGTRGGVPQHLPKRWYRGSTSGTGGGITQHLPKR